jgi:hypothetical protein
MVDETYWRRLEARGFRVVGQAAGCHCLEGSAQ